MRNHPSRTMYCYHKPKIILAWYHKTKAKHYLKMFGQYGGYQNITRTQTHLSSHPPHHHVFASYAWILKWFTLLTVYTFFVISNGQNLTKAKMEQETYLFVLLYIAMDWSWPLRWRMHMIASIPSDEWERSETYLG